MAPLSSRPPLVFHPSDAPSFAGIIWLRDCPPPTMLEDVQPSIRPGDSGQTSAHGSVPSPGIGRERSAAELDCGYALADDPGRAAGAGSKVKPTMTLPSTRHRRSCRAAMTLVELLAVIAIIGVLI